MTKTPIAIHSKPPPSIIFPIVSVNRGNKKSLLINVIIMPKKNGNEPIIAADALASLDNALILSESFFL